MITLRTTLHLAIIYLALFIGLSLHGKGQTPDAASPTVHRRVLAEEYTGSWCAPCVNNARIVAELEAAFNSDVIPVSIHTFPRLDSMATREGDTLRSLFSPPQGVPLGLFDRSYDSVRACLQEPAVVEVGIAHDYSSATRSITATLSARFVDAVASGDIRMTLYVVEDSVTGNGLGYNQANAEDNNPASPYYKKGSTIPGYIHRYVLRAVPSGVRGTAGVIPVEPAPGVMYEHTYHYTLPQRFDERRVSLVGFISYSAAGWKDTNAVVLNATSTRLISAPSSVTTIARMENEALIDPMPLRQEGRLTLRLAEPGELSIELHDLMGRGVGEIAHGMMERGEHRLPIDVSDLSSGAYIVIVKIDERVIARRKVIVAR